MLIGEADKDGDGLLDYEEFVHLMTSEWEISTTWDNPRQKYQNEEEEEEEKEEIKRGSVQGQMLHKKTIAPKRVPGTNDPPKR